MITKTSLLATRALLVLADDKQAVTSPRHIAGLLGESPAYMAKVLRLLVKAGILHAERGVKGGVFLARKPGEVTLLDVVEACQGQIVGSYCHEVADRRTTCSFHRATLELQTSIVSALSHWSLEDLAKVPVARKSLPGEIQCVMAGPLVALPRRADSAPSQKNKARL